MSRLLPAGLVTLAGVFMVLGLGGKLPHEWVGISTETLIGWMIVLAVPALFLVLLIVIMDRQRQLKRDTARILHRLAGIAH
jgi:putative effector of murein hydrolase LrgA (UPF0299 family)